MNTPNKLTIIRIILVPFFMFFMMSGSAMLGAIGIGVFIIASLTDWFDGYLARKNNQITSFGKFMDPLADKMLTTAAFLILMHRGYISAWILLIILSREFIVSGIRLSAAAEGKVVAASMWGKAKTVSQMAAIIISLVIVEFSITSEPITSIVINVLVIIATILTIISGIEYVIKNKSFISLK